MSHYYGRLRETLKISLIFLLLFGEINRKTSKLWLMVGVQDYS